MSFEHYLKAYLNNCSCIFLDCPHNKKDERYKDNYAGERICTLNIPDISCRLGEFLSSNKNDPLLTMTKEEAPLYIENRNPVIKDMAKFILEES